MLDDSIYITFSNDKIIEMETIFVVAMGSEVVRGRAAGVTVWGDLCDDGVVLVFIVMTVK